VINKNDRLETGTDDPGSATLAELDLLLSPDTLIPESLSMTVHAMRKICQQTLAMQSLLDLTAVRRIELSIEFANSESMQALNYQYRGKDSPTNVLSFESELPAVPLSDDSEDGNLQILGDLVFCDDVVRAEIYEQEKTAEQHWTHLIVHGTLHLCGYDHVDTIEAETMESLEIRILSVFGIPDPYETTE